MNVQWYPGHMTKAKRQMQEDIKLVDAVIELLDARCPLSSRNPDIDVLAKGKVRIVLLNKADLSDDNCNKKWSAYFQNLGIRVMCLDSKNKGSVKNVVSLIRESCKEKIERDIRKGIKNTVIRAMVVGIPNVGKSTFINSVSGKSAAKTGNKPGVTKGKQWISISKDLNLLDTPGILWPKFDDEEVGKNLAYIGSINDDILPVEDLSFEFAGFMKNRYCDNLEKRYGISVSEETEKLEILNMIAESRNCYRKGTDIDYHKTADIILDDFRNGRLGKITLEIPS